MCPGEKHGDSSASSGTYTVTVGQLLHLEHVRFSSFPSSPYTTSRKAKFQGKRGYVPVCSVKMETTEISFAVGMRQQSRR